MEDDIVVWLNKQPAWIRQSGELYIKNGLINDTQISQLADICVSEANGEDCSKYKITETSLLSVGTGKCFSIKSISNIKGVNAIDTTIPMNLKPKGINVVYGANGSGKSGYIRILKMVAGVRYREEIKANIYKEKQFNPECDITIEENGAVQQILHCNLRSAGEHNLLKDIDIFDSKIAQGYVNDEKEASFEPWIFSLFSALGKAAEDIKAELTRRNEKIKLNEYNIPKEIANVATVEALRQITYESNKEDYIKDFTKKDAADLEALKSKSQIEKNKLAIRIKRTQIDSLDELLNYFKRFEVFYSKDNFDKIATLESMWATQKGAYNLSKKLLEENIDYIDKKEQNDKAWRELWKAARTLYDGMNPKNIDYTSDGGICPLCHQRITYSVSKRMKTIDEYVNGKTSTAEQQAKLNYKQLLNYPQTMDTDELVKKTGEFEPEFKKVIEKVNSIILENKMNIDNFKDDVITIKTLILDDVIIPIKIKINYLQSIVNNFKKINEVDDQKEIIKSIHILEAKKTIKENELKIDENIKKLKDKHLFDEAIKKTSTNKLTTKSKELAKELITDAYVKCFNDELNKLSASGLTAQIVQGNGKKGKVPYKVQLRDAGGNMISPKDILSEGENRAVSLAAFFAEASRRTENSPLIIDDPISSLDYEYEARVISRLAEAAQKRQVIIFTHRISFVVGISDIIGDRTLFNELSLKSTKNRKGIPSEPDINARKADKLLNNLINDNLSKLKRKNELDNDFNIARHYLCQQFRNCVEKSVEEVLIGEVVMRFRKDVQTKRIKYLPSITQEDCDLVDEMMTKYSAYDHSMSLETPLTEFPVSDIETDMKKFSDWMRERRKIIT